MLEVGQSAAERRVSEASKREKNPSAASEKSRPASETGTEVLKDQSRVPADAYKPSALSNPTLSQNLPLLLRSVLLQLHCGIACVAASPPSGCSVCTAPPTASRSLQQHVPFPHPFPFPFSSPGIDTHCFVPPSSYAASVPSFSTTNAAAERTGWLATAGQMCSPLVMERTATDPLAKSRSTYPAGSGVGCLALLHARAPSTVELSDSEPSGPRRSANSPLALTMVWLHPMPLVASVSDASSALVPSTASLSLKQHSPSWHPYP
eukprot:1309983-Rhodomonas_salina.3